MQQSQSEKLLKNLGRLGRDIDLRGANRELVKYLDKTVVVKSDRTFKQAIDEFDNYYQGQIGQTIRQQTYTTHWYEIEKLKDLYDVKISRLDFATN